MLVVIADDHFNYFTLTNIHCVLKKFTSRTHCLLEIKLPNFS